MSGLAAQPFDVVLRLVPSDVNHRAANLPPFVIVRTVDTPLIGDACKPFSKRHLVAPGSKRAFDIDPVRGPIAAALSAETHYVDPGRHHHHFRAGRAVLERAFDLRFLFCRLHKRW